MNPPIQPWQSKLNWVGILTFLDGVVRLAMDADWTTADVDKFLLVVSGAIVFILRTWFTKGPTILTPIKV